MIETMYQRVASSDEPRDGSGESGIQDLKAWFAAIVENSDDAILSKTLDGIITSWNSGAERLFGFTAAEAIGQPVRILIPDDRQHEEDEILARLRRGEWVKHFETVRRRKDGGVVHISLTVSPVRDAGGAIIGASKIARDISERKRQEERQNLLLREMNHRVKNLFAVVSALIGLSERGAQGAEDLAARLRERLAALARAHELTLPELSSPPQSERTTTLFALLTAILAPHKDGAVVRTCVHGQDVAISGSALTSLALVLNEFSTNSAKYGSLSSDTGSLTIETVINGAELAIIWTESGGPEVKTSQAGSGFGSYLERVAIEGGLQGRISREWELTGLRITLCLPLARLSG